MIDGKFENLFRIIKFGKWFVKLYIKFLFIMKCFIELRNMLLINVVEWLVIFVGWKIWGWKKYEFNELIKNFELVWVLIFKRLILKLFINI